VCHGARGTPSGRRPARPADSLPLRASKQERGTYSHERARTHARTRFAASHVRATELPNYRHYLEILGKDSLLLELETLRRVRRELRREITHRVKYATAVRRVIRGYPIGRCGAATATSRRSRLAGTLSIASFCRCSLGSQPMRRVDAYPPLWRHHKVRRTHNRDTPRYSATSLDSPGDHSRPTLPRTPRTWALSTARRGRLVHGA